MRLRQIALAALAALALILAGGGVGLALAPARAPQSLATPEQISQLPAAARSFDDAQSVTVQVSADAPMPLASPLAGKLTSLSVAAGQELSSGQPVATIDGVTVVALSTAVPLWRDLALGDKGADVSALQAELARLGKAVTETGTLDRATRAAAAELLGEKALDAVPAARWLWLPNATVTVSKVTARVGQRLAEDTALFELPAPGASARITKLPDGVYPGERVFVLGDQEFATGPDGEVTDAAALMSSPAYQRAAQDSGVGGVWRLVEPIEVYAVPPVGLFGVSGTQGCVAVNGEPVPVTIVSSSLGQTLVTAERPLASVDTIPAGTCPSS